MAYYTAYDALVHLLDFVNEYPHARVDRKAFRALQSAYRDLINAGPWSYFLREFRLALSAPVSVGSTTYTHTGGTFEREVVRGSGVWPSWAKYGRVIISGVHYEVEERKNDTTLTLTENNNPGADVGSGTVTLYRDTYQAPADFLSTDLLFDFASNDGLQYTHPNNFVLARKKIKRAGSPAIYTVTGDLDEMGRMQFRFLPYPSAAANLDGMYMRRPRDITLQAYEDGAVTTSATSATITGSGTAWTASMIGSVIRIAPDGEQFGSGSADSDPLAFERIALGGSYLYERRITAVASATSLTVDSAIPTTETEVKHLISDPVEIELGVMQTALERMMEYHFATLTRSPYLEKAAALWQPALQSAIAADNRSMAMRRHMGESTIEQRLGDIPAGAV